MVQNIEANSHVHVSLSLSLSLSLSPSLCYRLVVHKSTPRLLLNTRGSHECNSVFRAAPPLAVVREFSRSLTWTPELLTGLNLTPFLSFEQKELDRK